MRPSSRWCTPGALSVALLTVLACVAGTSCGRAARTSSASPHAVEDTIRIDGSPALLPLARALAHAYNNTQPGSMVIVGTGLGSRERIEAVRQRAIQIALASQVDPADLAAQNLESAEVAKLAVVFAVPAGVTVSGLSSRQVCDIYHGRATSWHQVGGPELPIAPLSRPPTEVDAAVVLAGVGCFRTASGANVARIIERPEEMAAELAAVAGAIGMTSMPFVDQSRGRIKALALDGVAADADRVRRGDYPLTRSSFLVFNALPKGAVQRFVAFVRSDAGAKVIRSIGAVPLP